MVHLLGVLVESLKAKDALVPAMITGNKARREDEPGVDAKRASLAALVVALSAGALSSAWLIAQAPASPGASESSFSSEYEDHERRRDDD